MESCHIGLRGGGFCHSSGGEFDDMKSSVMECCDMGFSEWRLYDVELCNVDYCDVGFFSMNPGDVAFGGADTAVCNMFFCDV